MGDLFLHSVDEVSKTEKIAEAHAGTKAGKKLHNSPTPLLSLLKFPHQQIFLLLSINISR